VWYYHDMESWSDTMRAFLAQKADGRHSRDLELHQRAEKDAGAIVAMIRERYRPHRIYQWGSVLHPQRFREYSDIDVAVEGITDAEAFFRLLGEAEALTSFPLDVVQIEYVEPAYRALIKERGVMVYERPE
jgi:predicted nucleotidyltransferase